MKPKNSYNKLIREKLEERVKFFLDFEKALDKWFYLIYNR